MHNNSECARQSRERRRRPCRVRGGRLAGRRLLLGALFVLSKVVGERHLFVVVGLQQIDRGKRDWAKAMPGVHDGAAVVLGMMVVVMMNGMGGLDVGLLFGRARLVLP